MNEAGEEAEGSLLGSSPVSPRVFPSECLRGRVTEEKVLLLCV